MSSLRFLLPGCAMLGAAPLPPAATPIYPPRSLILFVAAWCAPCRAELRQVRAIAAAAAPVEVRVTPLDRSSATAAMLRDVPPARIWRSARAVDAFAHDAGSLPFSVMTDADGRPCATHDRALDTTAVLAMRQRCERASDRR